MGAEAKAKQKRRATRRIRAELEAAILAARRAGRDDVEAAAGVMAVHTGRDFAACLSEVRQWLASSSSPASSPSPPPAL